MTESCHGSSPQPDGSPPESAHRLGYAHTSWEDKNTVRQLDGLRFDKVFTDKVSGENTHRLQLIALLGHAREGDTVVVHSMDRLTRNLDDLRSIPESFGKLMSETREMASSESRARPVSAQLG
ncbi:recombinase family protein [Deinococcus aerolatus]|uniref:recombinase family protein n=1 Tax=Deinococcus aerolatus TaxID=522487 RepID=UPI001665DF5F